MQRYISTRPMFIDVRELSAGAAAGSVTDAAAAGVALRDLSQQYKGLLAAVKEEALVMEQVFPSPRSALAIFVQRVFEQRVQVGHAHGPYILLLDIKLGRPRLSFKTAPNKCAPPTQCAPSALMVRHLCSFIAGFLYIRNLLCVRTGSGGPHAGCARAQRLP